jgi:hypothetical protein
LVVTMMELSDDRPVVVGINGSPGTYRQAVAFAIREAALRRSAVRLVHGCQPQRAGRVPNNLPRDDRAAVGRSG